MKRNKNNWLLLILIAFSQLNCTSNNNEGKKDSDPKTWTVESNEEGKQGYVDQDGNVMIDFMFYSALAFQSNLAKVTLDRNSGLDYLINSQGEIVSEGYDFIETQDYPIIYGRSNDENGNLIWYLLDTLGKTVFGPYSKIEKAKKNGTFIISESCDTCGFNGERKSLISDQGKIISAWYNDIVTYKKRHFYEVHKNDGIDELSAAMNWKGVIISDWYGYLKNVDDSENYFEVWAANKVGWNNKGIIDSTGKELIPLGYRDVEFFINQNVFVGEKMVKNKNYFDIILPSGKVVLADFTKEFELCTGTQLIAIEQSGKKYAYFRVENNDLVKVSDTYPLFSSTYDWSHNGFFGIGKASGTSVKYAIPQFSEGLSAFKKNGKCGFIDSSLEVAIPAQFDDVGIFKDGVCKVNVAKDTFEIDISGNRLNN